MEADWVLLCGEGRHGGGERERCGGREGCEKAASAHRPILGRYDLGVKEIVSDLDRWQAAGERIAVATVVATRRSAPRPVGSKLGVSSGGELAGSVSGGCVENEVYGAAQEVLGGGAPRLLTYGISDDLAFEVGLPCGGEIDVWVEEPDADLLARLERIVNEERRAVLFTVLDGPDAGSKRLVEEGAGDALAAELLRGGRSKVLELEGSRVFAEVFEPPRSSSGATSSACSESSKTETSVTLPPLTRGGV